MHFTTASALAAFISVAAASPLALPQNAGTGSGVSNTCGISSFVPITGTTNRPTLDDCYKLRDQAMKSGPWKVGGSKQLQKFGTCAFYAQPTTKGEAGWVGNSDIHDLVEDAIKQWQAAGEDAVGGYKGTIIKNVGTAGEMPCDSKDGKQVEIAWTLGHS